MVRNWALLVAVSLGATASIAGAEDDELTLDRITIYGGSRDARGLLETPNAVSVVDEFEIERRQPSTYEELLGDLPGVTIDGGPRGIAQEPNIRGFQDEQIVLRIDGARQNFDLAHRGRFFTDPEVLKRVEVLRGGNSTLFGSGALGGVIMLETKSAADILDPDEVWGGRIKGGFNSQGSGFLSALTLAAQAEGFDALGFLSYRPMLSDLKDGNGDDILNSKLDSKSGLVKLGYEPGDHRFELSYQHYTDDGLTPPNANAAATPSTVVNRDLTFQTARAEWTWNPADSGLIDLSSLFYFNSAEVSEDRPADGRLDRTEYRTFGFELVNRSEFELGLPIRLSYGIEGYQDRQEASRDGSARLQAPDARARYLSAFTQADIALGHGFTLTPGLRFDWFDIKPDADQPSRTESEVSPKLALQWQPLDALQLWVTASQSFRAPSLSELYNDGVHFSVPGFPLEPGLAFTGNNIFIPTPDLKAERARQIELGGRYDERNLFQRGDRFTAGANAYYARVDNFVDTVVSFMDFSTGRFNPITGNFEINGSTRNVNIDAELWGLEGEVAYDSGAWFAGAGLTVPRGRSREGGSLGSIPQDRLVFTGGFRPLQNVEVGGRATLLRGQNHVPEESETTPGAAVFDLFASYAPDSGPAEGAVFAVGIDNVTNREYRVHPNGLNQTGIAFKASASLRF